MKFEEIDLGPDIMSGLADVNYTELTELQEEVLPAVLEGKDALVKAEPGSDKIASFVIPALEMIDDREEKESASVLVLTPNPEESQQIDELVWAMGYHAQIESASVDMDTEPEEQEEALKSSVQVITGNPGPLADITKKLRFVFRDVKLVVIDATDSMVELGLQSKLKGILRRVLNEHQTIIYTGEMNDEVKKFAKHYLEDPEVIGLDSSTKMLSEPPKVDSNLSHGYIYVPNRMKITTLMAHIEETPTDNCVIFTASKRGTDRLYRTLRKQNLKATSLHGKLSDEKRAQRFANFTNGDVQYLLVADIPAAELDIQRVTQVINYDVPANPDEYRYRADLVGSGKASRVVSLVSKQDRSDINELESTLKQAPKELNLPKKVKEKLKERKKKKKKGKKKSKHKKKKRHNNGRNKRKKKKKDDLELPRPSYDKLSGGRKGQAKKDQKSGVIGLIKELFS
ncbi:DEAD/DEAH box helicase [Fodinibius halophilus]|uniref:DEAD/DEAH box helicase n=1 Tax=Fodinibius halophilus TaxID=1736908 RepID=A0A6M1T7X9_9BACT|nr:DEAD/DEAH box helicase [Fodinibius halophilus]NGP87234.1 DEAD/DEAH box helicase [Fodinibius halophilus]